MKHLLVIQTALDEAFVCLSREGSVVGARHCAERRDHAAFLHPAIQSLLQESALTPAGLDAVAVVSGPGSYTGLRVGMSCAKGLCFALAIPLLTLNTLDWMAASASPPEEGTWTCPMIDARRMEVFTALYDDANRCTQDPIPLVLTTEAFADRLADHRIRFIGSGAAKWRSLTEHPNARFPEWSPSAAAAAELSWTKWLRSEFADLAYAEPFYGKAFHSTMKTAPGHGDT
jgi:tRNA threonylcarbamoyladenosine biosynthesis protein TsaB